MNDQEKLLWKLYFLELGYSESLIDNVINNVVKNSNFPKLAPKENAVIRQARPDWEKGSTISVEEKKRRDKLLKAIEETKRAVVRDLAVGMGTNDPRMQEGVAAFNALHIYNPTAAFEWGFPLATTLGLGTGYMLGNTLGELYGETGRTIGGLVGGMIGGGVTNLPRTNITPTAALIWQLNRAKPKFNSIPLNVGWGPRQTMEVSHLAETPISLFRLFNPDQWGHANEGLNPFGIWFSPRREVGIPRMSDKKRLKSARARATFLTRPYEILGDLTLEKPMVTIGEVPNRAAVEYLADQSGADGVIFNNVYDNGFDATTVIKSYLHPEITNIIERPRVNYYGPTMGKTTFVKNNPDLPFDDMDAVSKELLWNKRVLLANSLGINPRDFATDRVPVEIANTPLYKLALNDYRATILDFVSNYVANPANTGRTLLTSNRHVLDPDNKVFLSNTPVVPDFNTFLQRNLQRGFRETPEQALEWWDNIARQDNVSFDNRYVSEILGTLNLKARTHSGTASKTPESSGILGLQELKLFYASTQYRQRVKQAYPHWSEERVNAFIQRRLNDTDKAISMASFNRTMQELQARGRTTILNSPVGQNAVGLSIASDAPDISKVVIHEGLHFTSKGGKNPNGLSDLDAAAIAEYNAKIAPELTRSNYKKYLESPNKETFKELYKATVKNLFPEYTNEQLENVYNIMLKEGQYYNYLDELRSFGLTDVIDAWSRGEITNLNDRDEVYNWLVEAWNKNKLDPDFTRSLRDYRTDFDLWANFITKALGIVSVPTISAFLNKQKEYENNK